MGKKSEISQTPRNPELPRHRGVLFLEGVPQSTKAAFKSVCASQERTMRDVLITLMRDFVKKHTTPR